MSPLLQNLHALTAAYMTGIIWFVQIIHYPTLTPPAAGSFEKRHLDYTRRMGAVVGPVMILELALQILWLIDTPSAASVTGMVLSAIIWTATFTLQVPAHHQLNLGYDATVVQTLVRTNWIRTLAWTARSLLLAFALS